MRFKLHLQRLQVCGRELPLQRNRSKRFALRSDLTLDDAGYAEYEPIEKHFDAEPIDVERASPD
jgi:hypothetical protein